jgi:hypothetical protein
MEHGMNAAEIARLVAGKIYAFFRDLTDRGIILFWIAAVTVAGLLFWGLSNQARTTVLMRAVNKTLAEREEPLALREAVKTFGLSGRATELGTWFVLEEGAGAPRICVVFPLIADGIFSPALAVCTAAGELEKIIPLSKDARDAERYLSAGYIDLFKRRIEQAAVLIQGSLDREAAKTRSH